MKQFTKAMLIVAVAAIVSGCNLDTGSTQYYYSSGSRHQNTGGYKSSQASTSRQSDDGYVTGSTAPAASSGTPAPANTGGYNTSSGPAAATSGGYGSSAGAASAAPATPAAPAPAATNSGYNSSSGAATASSQIPEVIPSADPKEPPKESNGGYSSSSN